MNLKAPSTIVFYVAVVLGVLALLGALVTLGFLTNIGVWLALIGLVLVLVSSYTGKF